MTENKMNRKTVLIIIIIVLCALCLCSALLILCTKDVDTQNTITQQSEYTLQVAIITDMRKDANDEWVDGYWADILEENMNEWLSLHQSATIVNVYYNGNSCMIWYRCKDIK